MCVKILEAAGKLNMTEYYFFLRGGIVRKTQELEFEGPPVLPEFLHQVPPIKTTNQSLVQSISNQFPPVSLSIVYH